MGAVTDRRIGSLALDIPRLVGRRGELAEIKDLLSTARLITLTGVAGVGKTRLCQEVAIQVQDVFADGVCFTELAPLHDGGLLAHTIAMALDIPSQSAQDPLDDLVEFLRGKNLLLVLDNCEHLVNACADVLSTLLQAAPDLRVLATSRQPLDITGEHVWLVPPLPAPVDALPPASGTEYASLNLFAQCAATVRPGFRITGENRRTVAEICHQLDGIPLAIELAAVRLAGMSLEQLLIGLQDRSGWLTADEPAAVERHRSLRAAIDWSFRLCSPGEQLMWERLAVFPTSFDLESAERVCAGDGVGGDVDAVLDLVAGLLDKSILTREERYGRVRYRLLETIRQYGQEKLHDSEQDLAFQRRHRDWCQKMAEQDAAGWIGPHQESQATQLRLEHANIRSALDFSLTTPGDTRVGLLMAATLWFYWMACGMLAEGRYWMNRALRVNQQPSADRVRAAWINGWIAALQGDTATGTAMGELCVAYGQEHDDSVALACGIHALGINAFLADDLPRARTLLREAAQRLTVESARAPHDSALEGGALMTRAQLGAVLTFLGSAEEASRLCEDLRAICERRGERWIHSYVLFDLALAEWQTGRLAEAAAHARDSLRIKRSFNDLLGMALIIDLLAWIAAAEGEATRAAVLLGAAHRMWQPQGLPQFGSKSWGIPRDGCEIRCRNELGERTFQAARHRGGDFSTAQAVAYALAE
ncbi:ATP-binding protein [Actinopolymorpha alba]|uniref:ATP-binding protein n=1 Tax=Actinopolymorpha alba TaxID=533267 RepID=UPI000372D0AB|nr:AAA family ATPase [Actinopolymorpha alba]